jgi:ribonuclease M5
MKVKYPHVIVVEGKMDKDLLESFLDADIITTNGSEVSRETIEYVRALSKTRTVVVLTDPDAPGKRIRDILNSEVTGLFNAFIPKEKAIKKHKVGVAESDKATIMDALNHLMLPEVDSKSSNLTMNDLFELGLMGGDDSVSKRRTLENRLHIDQVNGKTLLKRLQALGLDRKDLEEALGNE